MDASLETHQSIGSAKIRSTRKSSADRRGAQLPCDRNLTMITAHPDSDAISYNKIFHVIQIDRLYDIRSLGQKASCSG